MISSRLPLFGVSTVALFTALLMSSVPAHAQLSDGTQPQEDVRRKNSGAKITTEPSRPEDDGGRDDPERVNDSYQPKGIEIGQFLWLPKVETDETYNSNVYAANTGAKDDMISVVRPELKVRSRFKQHELNFGLLAEQYVFARFHHDNRTEGQADVDGRYDFSSNTQATVFSELYSRHEDRGSPDDAHGLEPTPTKGWVNRDGIKHQWGRYTALAEIGADRREFSNVMTSQGTVVPETFRDRWELQARERAGYEMFPGYAAIVELTENTHRYDSRVDSAGYDRNSWGYRAETGVAVDVSQLIRGDFLVGYLAQDFNDPRFIDPHGLAVRASFNWTPTKLTVVVPSLERSVYDTVTTGASGMVHNGFTLTARHELARNVVLTGVTLVSYDELSGVQLQNFWTYEGRARVIYALTPMVYVGGELGYRRKVGEAETTGFTQGTAMVKIGIQY